LVILHDDYFLGLPILGFVVLAVLASCQNPTGGEIEEQPKETAQQIAQRRIVGWYTQFNSNPSQDYGLEIMREGTFGIMFLYNSEGIIKHYNINITSPGPSPERYYPGYVASFYFDVKPKFEGLEVPIGAHYYHTDKRSYFMLTAWDPAIETTDGQPNKLYRVSGHGPILQGFIDKRTGGFRNRGFRNKG